MTPEPWLRYRHAVDNANIHYPRRKTLGGSSARNYMAHHRGTVQSYQRWADQVDDQSYTFENLSPYFEKSLKKLDSLRQANLGATCVI